MNRPGALAAAICIAAATSSTQAEVWQYLGSNGETVFSDRPCPPTEPSRPRQATSGSRNRNAEKEEAASAPQDAAREDRASRRREHAQ